MTGGQKKMQQRQLTHDFGETQEYFKFLSKLAVPFVELRAFGTPTGTKMLKVSTDENGFEKARAWIMENNLTQQTVNCTFNVISNDALEKNGAGAICDADISYYRFLLIDIDPVKAVAKASASNQEKESTKKMAKNILEHLKDEGFPEPITIDSGNGIHILIPVEQNDVLETKGLFKEFLKILDKKFSNESAKIDTSVFNESRLGKLVGTLATKGEHTDERPHRLTKFLTIPDEIVVLPIKMVKNYNVNHQSLTSKEVASVRKDEVSRGKSTVHADVEKWLVHYNLPFSIKEGNKKEIKIFVLEKCPLDTHTNNQNGASVISYEDGRCEFKCLHASHSHATIADFTKKYPLPEEAKFIPKVITIEGLNDGEIFKRGKFKLLKEGLWLKTDESEIRCSDAVFASKITVDRDTKITLVTVIYYANGIWSEIEIGAEQLTTVNVKKLSKYNFSFGSRLEGDVVDFLNITKGELPIEFVHKKIGWVQEKDKLLFLLDKTYTSNEDSIQSTLSQNSLYCFDSFGNREVYENMIKEEVLGTNMEVALCIGFANLFIGYFKATGEVDIPSLVNSFKGSSTIGKSTTLNLIGSLYGKVQNTVRNFNATQAALIKLASDNHGGIPMLLDELGSTNIQDLSTFIHQFSSGRERLRMNKNRELDEQLTIETVLILSSERSLDDYVDDTEGQIVRRLEFSLPQWTKNAKSSERIKSVCLQNGGFIIKEVISSIFEKGPDILLKWFTDSKKELLPSMEDSPFKERFANNLALIKAGGKLIEETLGWNLNHQKIEEILLDVYHQTIENHFNKKSNYTDRVVQLLLLNANHFIVAGNQRNNGPIWGKVTLMEDVVKVNILQQQFRTVLQREFNTKDIDPILHHLLEQGLLKTEKDRKTKRVKINKTSFTTYEVLLPYETAEFFRLQISNTENSFLSNTSQFTKFGTDETKFVFSTEPVPLPIDENF